MTWRVLLLVVLWTVLSDSIDAGSTDPTRTRFVWADFDGDGLEDVYVVRLEGHDSLFRNVGDGSFDDVTAHALPCGACASTEVVWCDVDQDERSDLLRLLASGGVELLRNRGDGTFEDFTAAAGFDRVVGASAARWFDYDADGRADLELATEDASLLFHNLGAFLFEAVTFVDFGPTSTPAGAPAMRAIPGALDGDESSPSDAAGSPLDGSTGDESTSGSRRAGRDAVAVLSGSLIDKVHPDPLQPGTPPLDPLEPPTDAVDFQIPPFANRCAWSVRDTSTGDCVLTSTLPTLGKLYPISANLFVSSGGNVGIGTTTPTAKFEVAGTARVTDTLTLAPSGDQALDLSTGSVYKGGSLFLHTKGGVGNTAVGRIALAGSAGNQNTAVGDAALCVNAGGTKNTATGFEALRRNTSGSRNTASGAIALSDNTTGSNNTAHGHFALTFNSTGSNNTAVGAYSLRSNVGSKNTATGFEALRSNTVATVNAAHGYRALRNNTSGSYNTACGAEALRNNTTGSGNTVSGCYALFSNTTGRENAAIGRSALHNNTYGDYNTASGMGALFGNTTGGYNTAIGSRALDSNTTGNHNTVIGFYALQSNTTGSRNIAIGYSAGSILTVGDDNIAIASPGGFAESATIRVGTDGTHTRAFIAGIRGVTTGNANAIPVLVDNVGQLGTVSSSRRFKKDIADMGDATKRLLELRPVTFRYKQEQTVPAGDVPVEYGLIAEEVAEIFPDLVVYDEEGLPFTVKYHLLSSMLLNELKNLDDRLEEQGDTHTRELEELRSEFEARFATLQSKSSPLTSAASHH